MDDFEKHQPQMTVQVANPTVETHPTVEAKSAVSELLEDSGNCRQSIKLHVLSDSLFSEQQKLRHVLDWAHSFLSSGSEVHHEFCRADSLILANENQRETERGSPVYKHSSAAKYCHQVTCIAGSNEVFEGRQRMEKVWQLEPSHYKKSELNKHLCRYKLPFPDDPCIPFSFTPGRDEVTWLEKRETPETKKNMELHDATHKQTPSQDNNCRTSSLSISNQRQRDTNLTLASSDGATCLIERSTSSLSKGIHRSTDQRDMIYKTAEAQSEKEVSGDQMELKRANIERKLGLKVREGQMNNKQKSSSGFRMDAKDNKSHSESEQTPKQMENTANPNFSCHLKISANLSIYEQYQLCMDHFRMRESQQETPRFEFDSLDTSAEIKKHLSKVSSRGVTAVDLTKTSSAIINENQDRTTHNRNGSTLAEQGHLKTTVKETPAAICAESKEKTVTSATHLDLDSNKHGDFIKRAANSNDKHIKTQTEHLWTAPGDNVSPAEERVAANSVLLPKKVGHHPGVDRHQMGVKGQKKRNGGQGPSWRLCGKSSVSLSSLTNGGILSRSQSAGIIKLTKKLNAQIHTKRHTPEFKLKHTSTSRDGETPDDPRPTSQAAGTTEHIDVDTDYKYSPAGVPECDRWLCLPDEVWLSILSVLPHSDLCRVLQVCRRLNTVAADHSLWEKLRIENSTLSDRWLLCVGRRRPRSLCLYSCSGLSATSSGLEMFFSLCRNSLEELKVISCCGPGLHGDLMLPLIGQLCDHVTSVDMSWSGATDTGLKALSDGRAGLRLKAVVLNGCHVSDDPLMKLVMRHKESLCRLEVFGCQFLTPSCLQTIYEMCPGLQHLNIGQVPKVNTHSLTVMASQLKCLISLNLTGLQAVTNVKVETLLQSCINLQSLTLSSCSGVTDVTLHSISKYTPCIRSLDVSGCKAVTDAGIQSLALGCRRLQQLDVSSTDTGNRGVTLLANYCGGHLHTVKLSFCHISSESILKLCRRCKRLKVLHLYGCAQLPTEQEIRDVNTTVQVYPLP
ncbi:uncharacterized protein LOC122997514 [Thunnus albacares]|uniref:uncharacterized protein LOC122997514 n=1 Tax=Thunnus albacares TaxID=8236 RepID=UPI001CF6D32E|nr:uncharacterized protein LOC122997514 [Thunnus albacares]